MGRDLIGSFEYNIHPDSETIKNEIVKHYNMNIEKGVSMKTIFMSGL